MFNNQNKFSAKRKLSHYFERTYDVKGRFSSYWHQVDEIISLQPEKVLEVGIGNSFVSNYLKERGIDITSIDVFHGLRPNITASVLAIPFCDETFDVIACYEVLEHLPYNDFPNALKELARVSQRHIILSVPDITTVYRFYIELPKIKAIKKLIPHPFHRVTGHKFDDEHHWEIGKKGYNLQRIKLDIINSGLNILKTYRVFEFYYHRFFVLTK